MQETSSGGGGCLTAILIILFGFSFFGIATSTVSESSAEAVEIAPTLMLGYQAVGDFECGSLTTADMTAPPLPESLTGKYLTRSVSSPDIIDISVLSDEVPDCG